MSETEEDGNGSYARFNDHCVPHIHQHTSWDCGLACAVMVIRGKGILDCTLEHLAEQCALESIWTIDLAFLLRNYIPDFTFYTSYFGSRKEYQDNKFYKAAFDEDERRVNRLFASAKSCSVHIVRMVLPIDDYRRFLYSQNFVIIALVNAALLRCYICQEQQNCMTSVCGQFDSFLDRFRGYDYAGHYIVLVGYDAVQNAFAYRDPAITDTLCMVSAEDFDRARQAEGTDHDCIVVKLR